MTTPTPIEAGARAMREALASKDVTGYANAADILAKLCIEAAIATGSLVPASAVAEMRERCARWHEDQARVAMDSLHCGDNTATIASHRRRSDFHTQSAAAIRQLDLSPAGGDYVVVPKSALDWLFGEGPDADGKWFGECEDDVKPIAGKYKRTYWWRSKFRSLLNAAMGAGSSPSPNNGEG